MGETRKIAVTVNFCLPEAVAGAVQAGSQVAVFDTVVIGGTGQVTAQPGCAGSHQQPTGSIVKTTSRVRRSTTARSKMMARSE